MAQNKPQGRIVLIITVVIAMILTLLPLPDAIRFYRPEWVVMTLLYWAMALPERVGVGFAWVVGLLMDVLMGGALGVLAFSYALVTYLVLNFHLQLRQYPLWQQALIVLSLILIIQVITVVLTPVAASWHTWYSVVTSTLVWPVIYAVLRKIRRAFDVS